MREFTLGGFARFMLETSELAHERLAVGVGQASLVLQEKIKGVYGDNSKLQSLAPSTQAERVKKGFTPNDPLVRTGQLRENTERMHMGLLAGVGSSDPVAVYQELGTNRGIPARPAYLIGMEEAKDEMEAAIGLSVGVAVGAISPVTHTIIP